jgi:hypothetical protein
VQNGEVKLLVKENLKWVMKLCQKRFKYEHEIEDLQQTKLKTDSRNGITLSTHIFSCTSYFDLKYSRVD